MNGTRITRDFLTVSSELQNRSTRATMARDAWDSIAADIAAESTIAPPVDTDAFELRLQPAGGSQEHMNDFGDRMYLLALEDATLVDGAYHRSMLRWIDEESYSDMFTWYECDLSA